MILAECALKTSLCLRRTDWAKRVKDRTVGFGSQGCGGHFSMPSGPPPQPRKPGHGMRSDPDEWTLPPARQIHALEAMDRYDAKEQKFHFC